VEERYPMEPPHVFQHLDVSSCWPASDEKARQLLQQVVDPWAVGLVRLVGGDPLPEQLVSAHGTLRVCLLHMELFRDCEDDQVQDLRVRPIQSFHCQNRPALLVELAHALLAYEELLNAFGQVVPELSARMRSALDDLAIAARWYRELRVRRQISVSQGNPSSTKITAAMQTLTTMVQALPPAHSQQRQTGTSLHRYCRVMLFTRMRDGFIQYGPRCRRYPMQALDYSIAMILKQLGIEKEGTPEHIAERFRKRLARADKPSPLT